MPLDDYAVVGSGALRLKGAKVGKSKKKKKDKKLEQALESAAEDGKEAVKRDDKGKGIETERERESEEGSVERDEGSTGGYKTETQRRFEEAKRKKFLELQKNAASNPELLKTHKERVEELNHFLSKLSEHNDMPKIGPG